MNDENGTLKNVILHTLFARMCFQFWVSVADGGPTQKCLLLPLFQVYTFRPDKNVYYYHYFKFKINI